MSLKIDKVQVAELNVSPLHVHQGVESLLIHHDIPYQLIIGYASNIYGYSIHLLNKVVDLYVVTSWFVQDYLEIENKFNLSSVDKNILEKVLEPLTAPFGNSYMLLHDRDGEWDSLAMLEMKQCIREIFIKEKTRLDKDGHRYLKLGEHLDLFLVNLEERLLT